MVDDAPSARRAGPRGGSRKGCPNKTTAEMRELARKHGPALIRELARLAFHAKNPAVQVMAIKELLDRAYGRPPQAMAVGVDGGATDMIVRTGVRDRDVRWTVSWASNDAVAASHGARRESLPRADPLEVHPSRHYTTYGLPPPRERDKDGI